MPLHDQRREYGQSSLDKEHLPSEPWQLLKLWLDEAVKKSCLDATSFVLATAQNNQPDARVVLAKQIDAQGIVFYTNYQSAKGKQLDQNPFAAACFYWPELTRQIRVQGTVTKISAEQSASYFKSRPKESQAAAVVSPQSQVIPSRQALEEKVETLIEQPLDCPPHWGGFLIVPERFEFFQGRDSRVHDRFRASIDANERWAWVRLAP